MSVLLACYLLAPPAGAQDVSLTVMSFNIRYGTADDGPDSWPHRADLAMTVVRDHRPDVLGLQEALPFQLDELATAFPEYAQVGVGRDDGATAGEYAAVLYRADRYLLAAAGTFWLSDTPETVASTSWGNRITRICTWARLVDRGSGRAFWVFNVHFDHESAESRARSAELLAARLAARMPLDPAILMGDFNAPEGSAPMRYLRGAADRASQSGMPAPSPRLRDTFGAVHPGVADVGTFHGFRGVAASDRIDAILVTDGWDVLDADIVRWGVDGRYPSDHYPVTAELRLPDR